MLGFAKQALLLFERSLTQHPLRLHSILDTRQPVHPAPGELLPFRPQLRLHQAEVIDRADTENALSWERRSHAVHERAAVGAEVVGHHVLPADGLVLAECLELVLPSEVLQVGVEDGEIAGEHAGGDLVAVCGHSASLVCWLGLQSSPVQLQTNVSTSPGPSVGWAGFHQSCLDAQSYYQLTKSSWTSPQKHVAVARPSLEYPSVASPVGGKHWSGKVLVCSPVAMLSLQGR